MPDQIHQRHSFARELEAGHVHAWSLDLDPAKNDIAALSSLLCVEERDRADRLRFARDRQCFTICRGKLRLVLASYLLVAPQELAYRTAPMGKPELGVPFADCQLRFNLSRSGNRAMIAVTQNREVGVDIEQVKPMPDLSQLVDTVFSERERRLFHNLEEGSKQTAFLSAWTQKEAYLKARGFGLSRPPHEVSVGLEPTEKAGLIHDSGDPAAAECWSLTTWQPAQGYTAALAVQGHDWHLVHMTESCFSLKSTRTSSQIDG